MSTHLEERIRRGDRAKALLDDPLLKEAAEHVEAECWRVFKALAPTDTAGLAEVKGLQYLHGKYQAFLKQALLDGEQAKLDVQWKRRGVLDVVSAMWPRRGKTESA
jgi:hypothetical protein